MKNNLATLSLPITVRELTFAITIACAAILSAPADAAVYKWVDDAGKVHYTDQPQPGKHSKYRIGEGRNAPANEREVVEEATPAAPNHDPEIMGEQASQHEASLALGCRDAQTQLDYLARQKSSQADSGIGTVNKVNFQHRKTELLKAVSENCV